MCAQAAPQKQNKKNKKAKVPLTFNFNELDDKFLSVKGKALRNLRKKYEKYTGFVAAQKEDGSKLSALQQEQVDQLPQIEAEMNELEDLCRLYIESNPDYDKRNQAAALTEEDIRKRVSDAYSLVGHMDYLRHVLLEDSSLVGASEAERASLQLVFEVLGKMCVDAERGSQALQDDSLKLAFVDTYTRLASADSDLVTEGGVSFADLKAFVEKCFSDESPIQARIQEKALEEQRAKQAAEEEAARKAAEAAEAERQRQLEAEKAAKEEQRRQREAQEAAAKEEELKKKQAQAEAAGEEQKDTSEVAQQQQPEDQVEGQGAEGQKDAAQRGGRRFEGERGDRRGGRGDRGDRGDRRGGRGNRGGGRGGGYRNNRGGFRGQQDDDDFILETGEKKQPRRDNRRGRRGDWRGGNRGDRGDFRGDGERRGGRGGRPQTAQQQEQPGAEAASAQQPAAKGQGEV